MLQHVERPPHVSHDGQTETDKPSDVSVKASSHQRDVQHLHRELILL